MFLAGKDTEMNQRKIELKKAAIVFAVLVAASPAVLQHIQRLCHMWTSDNRGWRLIGR